MAMPPSRANAGASGTSRVPRRRQATEGPKAATLAELRDLGIAPRELQVSATPKDANSADGRKTLFQEAFNHLNEPLNLGN